MYPAAPAARTQAQAGQAGLVVLRYTGVNDVDTYIGPATGTAYLFGLERRRGYVDAHDAPGMVEITEDGLQVFAYG